MKKFDYKSRMKNMNSVKMGNTKKIVATVVIASALVLNTSQTIPLGSLGANPDYSVQAASLAEVQLLTDVAIGAALTELADNPNFYNLGLNLTGTGLADAEVISPDRTVVFYAPELAGLLTENGPANVSVEILPVTMADLPALGTAVGGVTGTVTDLVTGLTTTLDGAINGTPLQGLVEVQGLAELGAALENLNNLDAALADLLAYNGQAAVSVTPEGAVVVTFPDGLGNHVETAVIDVVQGALSDVLTAANNLDVVLLRDSVLLGPLLNSLVVDPIVDPLLSAVLTSVDELQQDLTNGLPGLANELAGVQVIGNTTINANVLVDRPAGIDSEVTIAGAGIQGSVVDAALLSSLTSTATVVFDEESNDVTPPDQPVVDEVAAGDTAINGTTEPGATVEVTFPNGTTAAGTADGEGNFEVAVPEGIELAAGDELEVTATDEAGNESDPTVATVVAADGGGNGDVTAPAQPEVDNVAAGDTEITGSTEPGATVEVTFPGGTTATGTANGEGDFQIAVPEGTELAAGDELEVTATDEAGNESDPTVVTVTAPGGDADLTAPAQPEVDNVEAGATEITGSTEPGATVEVTFPAGTTATGTADGEGNFEIEVPEDIELAAGDELEVTATDAAGNESDPTVVKVTAPGGDGDVTAPAQPEVDRVEAGDTEITGETEPGATVEVTFPDGTTASDTADEDGNFEIEVPEDIELAAGDELEVVATDEAGNESDPTVVTVVAPGSGADVTAPAQPEVDDVEAGDEEITGKTEPGATVEVTLPDGTTATDTADGEGNFEITLPEGTELEAGDELEVVARDAAGNESEPTVVTVAPAGNGSGAGGEDGSSAGGSGSDYKNNSGIKLPLTSTGMWNAGLAGAGALLAGIAMKLFRRKKKTMTV